MRYAIVIEGHSGDYAAFVPDLPGCIVAGETLDEVHDLMQAAIRMHINGLQEDGLSVPAPTTIVDYIEM
jgi:predicted RNase H-like HicB family nuclease